MIAAGGVVAALVVWVVLVSVLTKPEPASRQVFDMGGPPPAAVAPVPVPLPPPVVGPGEVRAVLTPAEGFAVTGTAEGRREANGIWTVSIRIQGALPNESYSVIVVRTGGDPGTPGPTPCEFRTDAAGAGGCAGTLEAITLGNANVMGPTGAAVAHGTFG